MAVIQAADYSTIKSKVDAVFGAGSGQSGYGQTVTSPTVIPGQRQTASQWIALRNDMVKARQHQTGTAVGTSTSTDGNNLRSITAGTLISTALLSQYNNFANVLQTNKFEIAGTSNYSDEALTSSTRTTSWNGTLTHTIQVVGNTSGSGSAANMRYFFNAGGSIKFSATITGYNESGTNQKGWTWDQMLQGMGTVTFNYNATSAASGTGSGIGWYNLTTSDQVIYTKNAPAGSYSSNLYRISARRDASSTLIIFTIQFQDNAGTNPLIDENISGTLTSTVKNFRPSGSNVSVLAHTASNTTTL
jgi:hypothetical protein